MLADQSMSSMRPFLVSALRDWILANGMTPHLRANTQDPGISIPVHLVASGPGVVFNVAPKAVDDFRCKDDGVSFGATFNRSYCSVFLPYSAVEAIYAQETGRGMVMPEEDAPPPPGDTPVAPDSSSGPPAKSRSHLRVVK